MSRLVLELPEAVIAAAHRRAEAEGTTVEALFERLVAGDPVARWRAAREAAKANVRYVQGPTPEDNRPHRDDRG